MAKFRINPEKRTLRNKNTIVSIDPTLHQWLKIVAAIGGVIMTSALNQALEYAKNNSERIAL